MEHFTVVDTIIPELIEFGEFSKIVKYVSRFCMNDTKTGDSNYKFNRLPDKLTLYDFLEINSAAEWDFPQKDVSEKGLEIPIGLGANGKKVILNFTSCRGHGILAGMTGSGKSQFLLSMIVLLSLKYKPDFFSFAIIDFKADASAMQLRELPNFVGALSDLDDESQLNRALVMLDCESKRRQKILNDAKKNAVIAVNEIEYYHQAQRLGKKLEALPYLLVIVDEFVDAKRSDPNFLEKMACIARQGRSRGIYLLLAAQNPSSEIGGQIAANVGYNICFKVRDDAISTAVIKNSIAADIDSKLRGRGYLLTDVDGLIEFQTPYCGEEVVCQGIASTQLEEIISVLKQQKLSLPRRIFEEPLPTEIVPTKECLRSFDIDSATADVLIPVGWGDNIYAAKMELFSIPFSNGNVMVFGNPGTGKTTLMQTILFMGCARYSPEDLQFVVCAFGDSSLRQFEKLPHVRSVISFEDIELLQRLPARLKREVDIRKAVKVKRPTLVILIDRMESLVQECLEIAEQITELSSISFKYNIFFVFSSIRHNILSSDKRQSIKTWIGFQTDNEPYSNYMPLREVKKPTAVPGRSLSYINGSATIETQFFVVDRFGISINENIKKLKEKIDIIADYYDHPSTAFDIETIPEPVSSREIEDCDSSILPLGLRWEYSFGPDGYHFTDSPFFVVSGYSQMEVILGRMAIFAAATDNFRVDSVYFCNPNIRMFAKELSDNHKIKCYGDDLLQDFFEAVRDLFVKPPANHSFVFINLLSLLESKAQTSEDTRQHYQTFVKELREQSSQLLCKKIHFVISDYAGLLVPNRTLSSVLFATNQYAHGIICGGTTKNRIGAEALRGESQIPEGFGYLYGSGNSLTLVKLQNRD